MNNLFNLLFSKRIPAETLTAHINRLPKNVRVQWFRDGKYIIGNVSTNDYSFCTQGKDGNDFVEMVNDAIYTMYDIPTNLLKKITYYPPEEEMEKLRGTS